MAYTTGRYVPVYKSREIDDRAAAERSVPADPRLAYRRQAEDDTVEVIDGVEIYQRSSRSGGGTGYYPSVGPGWLGTPG